MKKSSTVFLQVVIVLIGVVALSLLLWLPQIEGRNVNSTFFEVYFKDPFLAYAYIASISFFIALYHAFKLLSYAGQNRVFSKSAIHSMKTIKLCALSLAGFVVIGLLIILLNESDDRAGGVAMGVSIAFVSIVIAATAALFERVLQSAVDIKSENDLTV